MSSHTIAPVRQLRLVLPEAEGVWPEEVRDTLPEDIQRELLVRLAQLLCRWFENRRES